MGGGGRGKEEEEGTEEEGGGELTQEVASGEYRGEPLRSELNSLDRDNPSTWAAAGR